MAQVLSQLPKFHSDRLLVGLDVSDDAAVYKLNDEQAIIQTLDFFTPVADDPYTFGQIAAANALSDIYAMGGEPIVALNIVGFPKHLDPNILAEILKGGADKVMEAGALLVGGHSVEDGEPKYGLSVTGIIHPDNVKTNADARVGDVLVLTKPLGSGILNTAVKGELIGKEEIDEVVKVMSMLNKNAAKALDKVDAHAVTDITGFGVGGHAYEVASNSGVTIVIDHTKLPLMSTVIEKARKKIVPGGTFKNIKYYSQFVDFDENIDSVYEKIVFDPQTSGGLLVSLPKDQASIYIDELKKDYDLEVAIIGEVIEKKEKYIYIK